MSAPQVGLPTVHGLQKCVGAPAASVMVRAARRGRTEWGRVKVRVREGKRLQKEKRDNKRKVVSTSSANRCCKRLAPKAAGKKRVEKEKRDKEMKVAVER